MPKFNVDIHFDVYCEKCGRGICKNCDTNIETKSGLKMHIEPCSYCLNKEFIRGKKETAHDS